MEILFIPVHYKLDRIPDFTNKNSFIFVHNIFGLYARLFLLIFSLCIYSGKLTQSVYPFQFLLTLFTLSCCNHV